MSVNTATVTIVECDECEHFLVFRQMNESQAAQMVVQVGWHGDKSRIRCPKCVSRR